MGFSLKRAAAVVVAPATLFNSGNLGPPASETVSLFEVLGNSTEKASRRPTKALKCHRRPADYDCQNEKNCFSPAAKKSKNLKTDSAKIAASTVIVEQSDWLVSDAAE